ncbi:MAG: MFS transporter [Burkholderiaceae bacterium]
MIVACPLLLQNLDTSVMATALPVMADSLQVSVLDLNLAITSYLLSLAVFLPASAWLAERFGERQLFCTAILVFSLGSALCGMADTLGGLVACRLLQGIGGSMMVPVGRSILLRSVPPDQMVKAMVWFTIPGAIGRLAGPVFGGAIVTVASWRWIFLVNIPFGLLGAALAWWFIERDEKPAPDTVQSFDALGLTLLAIALVGLLGGLEMAGKSMLPRPLIAAMVLGGVLAMYAYIRRSRAIPHPLLDLGVLRFDTFRIVLVGGFPMRVAIGAAPFLLPLMFQLGFGMTPLQSGLLTMATALGSLATRAAVTHAIRLLGFRPVMICSAVLAAVFYASYGLFGPDTSRGLMFSVMFFGGLCTAMTMVALNTVGYSDIPRARAGHATAMASMGQQISVAVGVVLGATVLAISSILHGRGPDHVAAPDFPAAFASIAVLALCSALAFRRLRPEDGEELRGMR